MIFETINLQKALTKANKGATNNTFIPITSMINIIETANSNTVKFITTNGDYALSVLCEQINTSTSDVSYTVDLGILYKLINSFNSDTVKLTVEDSVMIVKGNGTYKIPLETDEGMPIVFPNYTLGNVEYTEEIYSDNIKDIIKFHKASLPSVAQEKQMPTLAVYYLGSKFNITTNGIMVCKSTIRAFSTDMLVPPIVLNLLAEFDDVINVTKDENNLYSFTSDEMTLLYVDRTDISEYPVDSLLRLFDTSFTSAFMINRRYLVDVLNRMSLFIGPYDDCGITMSMISTGADAGITVASKNKHGDEKLVTKADKSNADGEQIVKINAEFLKQQLKSMTDESFVMSFGSPKCIEISDETTTRLIALQGE